mmetsp:Transcript_10564/g.16192  ORF Transcript_10564/g.16192 Transcript_10564/m.16192 type:complete len:203 (-) Transcript_10564:329-937(-)
MKEIMGRCHPRRSTIGGIRFFLVKPLAIQPMRSFKGESTGVRGNSRGPTTRPFNPGGTLQRHKTRGQFIVDDNGTGSRKGSIGTTTLDGTNGGHGLSRGKDIAHFNLRCGNGSVTPFCKNQVQGRQFHVGGRKLQIGGFCLGIVVTKGINRFVTTILRQNFVSQLEFLHASQAIVFHLDHSFRREAGNATNSRYETTQQRTG